MWNEKYFFQRHSRKGENLCTVLLIDVRLREHDEKPSNNIEGRHDILGSANDYLLLCVLHAAYGQGIGAVDPFDVHGIVGDAQAVSFALMTVLTAFMAVAQQAGCIRYMRQSR